jgi:hypothetical protein
MKEEDARHLAAVIIFDHGQSTYPIIVSSYMMTNRARAPRAATRAGSRRWGDEEKRLASRLLRATEMDPTVAGGIDYRRVSDTGYLRDIHKQHEFFLRHALKNFYQNIRRAAREFSADQALQGKRRLRESFY